jgi:V/A-type H+-transporting ATPase subunit K
MNLGLIGAGLVMGLSAVGSAIGIGIAGQAVIGAWKKCYIANKPAPMTLLAFGGAPLTQTFYGYILGFLFMKPAALAAAFSSTAKTLSELPILPGLMRIFAIG